jgi:hypothetical protein
VLAGALGVGALAACTSEPSGPAPDPLDLSATVPNETLVPPDQTLPPVAQIPAATAQAILEDVTNTIGIDLPPGANDCIVGALVDITPLQRLIDFGPNGVLADAPEPFQDVVYTTIDGCVDADTLAQAASPVLVNGGTSATKATCFFRLVGEEMGLSGLYRYSAAADGALPPQPELVEVVNSITKRCAIDLTTLGTTTTSSVAPTTTTTTTVLPPGATTSTTIAGAPVTQVPVVNVVTNAPPVTLATTTTAPLRAGTTIAP